MSRKLLFRCILTEILSLIQIYHFQLSFKRQSSAEYHSPLHLQNHVFTYTHSRTANHDATLGESPMTNQKSLCLNLFAFKKIFLKETAPITQLTSLKSRLHIKTITIYITNLQIYFELFSTLKMHLTIFN